MYISPSSQHDKYEHASKVSNTTILLKKQSFFTLSHLFFSIILWRVKYNLNELSHDTAMSLIEKLYGELGLNIVQIFVDTVGDPLKYENKLKQRFPKIRAIKVSKKADSLFPCVSAASICAKVTRDSVIHNWKYAENVAFKDYGSGYPGG